MDLLQQMYIIYFHILSLFFFHLLHVYSPVVLHPASSLFYHSLGCERGIYIEMDLISLLRFIFILHAHFECTDVLVKETYCSPRPLLLKRIFKTCCVQKNQKLFVYFVLSRQFWQKSCMGHFSTNVQMSIFFLFFFIFFLITVQLFCIQHLHYFNTHGAVKGAPRDGPYLFS